MTQKADGKRQTSVITATPSFGWFAAWLSGVRQARSTAGGGSTFAKPLALMTI